jgi:hypothetical protein
MLPPVSWYHLPEKSAGRCCYPLPIMQPEEVRGLASDLYEEDNQHEEDNRATDPKRPEEVQPIRRDGKCYILFIFFIYRSIRRYKYQ